MKQSSTAFMDEMLKDNVSRETSQKDINEQIGEMIDKRLNQAMSKFTEELAKVNNPAQQEKLAQQEETKVNEERKEVNENEEAGSKEGNE